MRHLPERIITPLQERIIAVVNRAGRDGICGDDLFAIVYDGQLPSYHGGRHGKAGGRQRKALKAMIWNINRHVLDHHGWRIVGSHCAGGWYWLVRS